MSQLYRISYFFSGEDLFNHVEKASDYGSLVYQGLMPYLSFVYPEEIQTTLNLNPKKKVM